jgi:predicted transcriptional regulator
LVHHLRVLEREEKIYSKKMGKYKLFYVSSYRRQASIRDYISPFQLRIVEIILQNPGIVPKKLSKILDRTQTDMSYHLSELSRNGLLEKRKKGRHIHYYIADEFSEILS